MNDNERDDEREPERHDEPALDGQTPIDPALSSDAQMIERARRRYGSLGAVVASGMLGIDKILGRRPKEEIPSVWEAWGNPATSTGMAFASISTMKPRSRATRVGTQPRPDASENAGRVDQGSSPTCASAKRNNRS